MKITLTILLGCIALTMMSFLITKDEPKYKNLKILPKDITKEQMDSVMHHFSAAVGQKCNFCHVFNQEEKKMDFASDAKEQKETARAMWKMTAKINDKFFEVKDSKKMETSLVVTCYTCHHGDEHPEKNPQKHMGPPPAPGSAPQGPAPANQQAPPPQGVDTTKHQ